MQSTLARQIRSLRLEDNFVLAGFRADLDRWLPNFDAFVLPSYTEGLPNVVLEASAARVPVVATAVGGTPEALENGLGGFLVPPGDTVLARRIGELLGDVRLRKRSAWADIIMCAIISPLPHRPGNMWSCLKNYSMSIQTRNHK